MAQADHVKTLGAQLVGLRGVVVSDQHIAAAFNQASYGVVHIERNQAAFEGAKVVTQGRHPGRKEGKCQGVRHRKLHHVLARCRVAAQHGARGVQGLQHFERLLVECGARSSQARGVGTAVHQIHAGPGF